VKKGKYMDLPEGPADMKRLWREAATLDANRLPGWLTPEDTDDYRQIGSPSCAGLTTAEKERFFAELRELVKVRIIIYPDPVDSSIHHLYLGMPLSEAEWSIGIYQGQSPLALRPAAEVINPVLTRADVTDVSAVFVADPFMLRKEDNWYLFFEVMNWRANKGEIGLATSGDVFGRWTYRQIVLAEPFHLSYPYVFEWAGSYYMIPESYQAGAIRLYKARRFPWEWSLAATLLEGPYLADASVFRHGGQWWMLAETKPDQHGTLRLYHADALEGPWVEHPHSPVITEQPSCSRPAGRIIHLGPKPVRFAQNCEPNYGTAVRAFEISELTPASYREREMDPSPVLAPGGHGWNAAGMHHLDAHRQDDGRWIACVDGCFEDADW
jgi:hypothetical protein